MKMETTKIFLYVLGIWFIFVIAAILNDGFRESFIIPKLGEYAGHVISTVILICVVFIVMHVFIGNLKITCTKMDLLLVGAFWLILTIVFKFVFGHYVMGNPWDNLFAGYNIFKGRVWSLVLLSTFFAPLLVGGIRK